jgi:hypothetical protein
VSRTISEKMTLDCQSQLTRQTITESKTITLSGRDSDKRTYCTIALKRDNGCKSIKEFEMPVKCYQQNRSFNPLTHWVGPIGLPLLEGL